MIGLRTALFIYALLVGACFATLKGNYLKFGLVIVLALAVKTYLDHLRRRME